MPTPEIERMNEETRQRRHEIERLHDLIVGERVLSPQQENDLHYHLVAALDILTRDDV